MSDVSIDGEVLSMTIERLQAEPAVAGISAEVNDQLVALLNLEMHAADFHVCDGSQSC